MTSTQIFWTLAAAMTALALAFVLPRLLARRAPPPGPRRAATNAAIYRAELAALERELAEGRIDAAEHARARAELERRLVADVDADATEMAAAVAPSRRTALALACALPLAAVGVYLLSGDPAAVSTVPVAGIAAAAPRPGDRADLVAHLQRHPGDGRARVLLARLDFAEDRFAAAAEGYRQALAASPKVAADAGIWCEYADALGMAQGGTLAGQPGELVQHALALDAAHPKALEMAGSAAWEARDYVGAARHWQVLLAQLPERSREHAELAAALERAQRLTLAARAGGQAPR